MQIFMWRSEASRAYAQGYILAVGATVEEARVEARKQFEPYLRTNFEWLFSNPDDDDKTELNEKLVLFEMDILSEPVTASAFVLRGSD